MEVMCDWKVDCLFCQVICYFISEDATMAWDPLDYISRRELVSGKAFRPVL